MPESEYIFEDIINIVSQEYGMCVEKARELFTDEQAIQSASATMFINATKEQSSVTQLINRLKEKIAKTNSEAIPSAILDAWKWHFRDFIASAGPRLVGTIAYNISIGSTPEIMERNVKEKYYHLMCEKADENESKALAEILFEENENYE